MSEIVEIADAEIDYARPFTREEAEELTAHIRNAADVMYVLIARAHAGRVWEALEYPTWEAYVQDEFNMSRSRSYQLLDQAKVVAEIEAAAPEGTSLNINEKTARDLKKVLGEVADEVADRTEGMSPQEASETIDDILNEYRSSAAGGYGGSDSATALGSSDLDPIDFMDEDDFYDDLDGVDSSSYGDSESIPEPAPVKPTPPAPANGIDPVVLRRTVQACYDLYASLSSLKSMPDVESVIKAIPVERHIQVTENIDPAMEWLSSFAQVWKEQNAGNSDVEGD